MDSKEINPSAQVYLILGFDESVIKSYAKWLDVKDNYLVVLDTKEALELNNTIDISNLIIKKIETIFDITRVLSTIAWQFIFLDAELIVLPNFEKRERTLSQQIIKNWQEIKAGVHLSASAFVDFQLPDLTAAMKNIQEKLSFSGLSNLKSYFNKTPAIICGAGPSLSKSLINLKEKALIFSGGSALNALNFEPHFIGLIDRATPLDFFEKDFNNSVLFSLIKAPYEILSKKFKHKFLCMPEESHLFFKWIFEQFNEILDPINVGWTVVTFLTSLAIYLGCDPIIFNGVDLGFKKGQIYAQSVSKSSYDKKLAQRFITTKNIIGEKVQTQNDWFMSAIFLQNLTSSHPDITFYNTSKEGLSLGESVKYLEVDEMQKWTEINITKKINELASRPILELKSEINNQILSLIETELEITQEKLIELEKIYNNKCKASEKREKSWCEENVLTTLWDIFKLTFLRGEKKDDTYPFKEKLHQILFFKDVLEQHKNHLKKQLNV